MFSRSLKLKISVLVTVPLLLLMLLIGFRMQQSNKELIRIQAENQSETVARQVLADRKHYVDSVVKTLKGSDHAAQDGYKSGDGFVPLPATFVIAVADDVSSSQDQYRYGLVSPWNLNAGGNLSDDFLQRGFENLLEQERAAKSSGQLSADKAFTGWEAYVEVVEEGGHEKLRYMMPDPAASGACVTCHNNYEQKPEIAALRRKAGVDAGHVFQLNDLMGAIAVEVELDEIGAVSAAGMWTTMLWLLVGTLATVGGILLALDRSIFRPMALVTNRMENIAQGEADLTQRVALGREDEIGHLANAFDGFIARMQAAIRSFGEDSSSLAASAEELAAISSELRRGMESASGRASEASGLATEVDENIVVLSSATTQMNASITEIARGTSDAAQIAQNASRLAGQTNSQMARLDAKSSEIGDIVDVIASISEQTNLLALNATIEAARAGEAGRGFAVVAHEVKELAQQTADATDDIRGKIEEVQENTTISVREIAAILKIVGEIDAAQTSIASAVEEQSTVSSGISDSLEGVAHHSKQISSKMTELRGSSTETSIQTTSLNEASSELAAMAERLSSLVGEFKT